jgi:DNA-binding winged helix-turn-helix (wHTH) protein
VTHDLSSDLYEFGDFLLSLNDKQLMRNGVCVPMPPRVFDTLVLLVAAKGQLVDKDYLLQQLWPDTFVEEGALAHNISLLRKALGESAGASTFIQTVPKRGYRFLAPIRSASRPAPIVADAPGVAMGDPVVSVMAAATKGNHRVDWIRRRVVWGIGPLSTLAGATLALTIVAAIWWRPWIKARLIRRELATTIQQQLTATQRDPGQAQRAPYGAELGAILRFETRHQDTRPGGWRVPVGNISVDGQIVHGGRWSVRLERNANSAGDFSSLTQAIPRDFTGATIELRGFLRSEDVSGYFGLWMREDSDTHSLAFENMQRSQLNGTHDWTEYTIKLPVHRDAKQLYFGVLLSGTGRVWADDLQLLVDGTPVWLAPKVERP